MDNGQSPVQPLDSTGTDTRLANMLATAKDASGPQSAESAGQNSTPGATVPTNLCPNCFNGNGTEVELEADNAELVKTTGTCPKCGYDAKERLYF